MTSTIKGVLIDSGKVLNYPKTGDWFITPHFFNYVNQNQFNEISKSNRQKAFKKAGKYIAEQAYVLTQEEELKHFIIYYEILFKELSTLKVSKKQIESIAKDLVYNDEKYVFYRDAVPFLEKSKLNYKLAIVSDAWPSLEQVFLKAGVRKHFESFIISSMEGTCKPDSRMYMRALEELGLQPSEAIFIDDRKKNCEGAKALGIKTVFLCRDQKSFIFNKLFCRAHVVVKSLEDINFSDF